MLRRTLLMLLMALARPATATSPTWDAWKTGLTHQEPLRVLRYVRAGGDGELVVVSGGRKAGVLAGAHFKVYRQAPAFTENAGGRSLAVGEGPMWVEMGRLKIVEVQDEVAVARVEAEGSGLSKALFPRYPGIMGGDLVVERQVSVARKQIAVPTVSVTYHEIFADPKRLPGSFELRAEGHDMLRGLAARFAQMRLSMLMIEGYTDHNGPSDQNQVESYQRAMTVRQFLVDELGFDERRVVAVGYGEGEPADASCSRRSPCLSDNAKARSKGSGLA
jgi:hypothetical protein